MYLFAFSSILFCVWKKMNTFSQIFQAVPVFKSKCTLSWLYLHLNQNVHFHKFSCLYLHLNFPSWQHWHFNFPVLSFCLLAFFFAHFLPFPSVAFRRHNLQNNRLLCLPCNWGLFFNRRAGGGGTVLQQVTHITRPRLDNFLLYCVSTLLQLPQSSMQLFFNCLCNCVRKKVSHCRQVFLVQPVAFHRTI